MTRERRETRARTQLQTADFPARYATQTAQRATSLGDERRVDGDREHRTQPGHRILYATAEEPEQELEQRAHEQPQEDTRQLRQRRADHRRANAMTLAASRGMQQRAARAEAPAMARHRGGVHDHSRAQQVNSPTEVEFFAEKRNVRGEPRHFAEHVVAHQQARRRQGEDVTHCIVLFLVAFARVYDVDELPGAVAVEPHVLQHVRCVPLDQLRPDHRRVRTEGFVDQPRNRVGPQRDVVVQHEKESIFPVNEREGLVDDRTKTGVALHGSHQRGRQRRPDAVGHLGGRRAGDEGDQPNVGILLGGQPGQRLGEPLAWLMDDHDRHDRWGDGRALRCGDRHDPQILPMTNATHCRMRRACKS